MQRRLELATAAVGVAVLVALLLTLGGPDWRIVLAFGAVLVVAENTPVMVSGNAAVSPGFMLIMAAIAVAPAGDAVTSVAIAAAMGAVYVPFVRARRFTNLAFNAGQLFLAAAVAAGAYGAVDQVSRPLGALAAAVAYGIVNVGFVLPYASLGEGGSARATWHEMRPMLPNYLSFGLLGLLIGLVCKDLGPWSILLLAVPMGIGRWTFRSFQRTKDAHEAAIRVFVRLIEAKDPYTAGHTERVAKYAVYIGEEMDLDAAVIEHLRESALMHDVGKLAVPHKLLNKPGRLTPEEWEVVRRHNDIGIGILGQVDFMRTMAVTASDSHGRFERGDRGTPAELVLEAHVVAVADAFDAMTSTRSYRRALDQDIAFAELRAHAGTQFNPECVEALIRAVERRGERYGLGFEHDAHVFAIPPPVTGVGSAGLGDLDQAAR